uniref:Putative LOC101731061 [Xenopus (Silurana) tropicalis] n=1 Tax=Lepeophtheirus salmonis TaxID=72036 RepID=A0A0K2T5N4_LEPSM
MYNLPLRLCITFRAIIAFDFSKAFDLILHGHALQAVKKLLLNKYLHPVRALLFNGTSVISMGDRKTDPIALKRVVGKAVLQLPYYLLLE